ncbi:MAG: hypothetical protein K2K19_01660 [Acetatifactor sp.]|nr:hypothetical protein [Acetatifactor sp.]
MKKQTKYEGFFSVEAALVLPAVLGVYVFLIVMLFLQYDRCLLEQDMASMMIKVGNYAGTPQQRMEYLQELTAQWDRERYLWVEPQTPYFTIRGSQVRLEAAGEYTVPILGFSAGVEGTHRLENVYQMTVWDRTALVYVLVGRQNKKEDREENEQNGFTE